jgi:hypothetical protein
VIGVVLGETLKVDSFYQKIKLFLLPNWFKKKKKI